MRRICIVAVIFVFAVSAVGQATQLANQDCDHDFGFKFLITHNFPDKKRRDVYVFMDPAAFNDENLKKLFSYFSTKYRSPKFMSIRVETSWYRVPAPNIDCEGSANSGEPDDPERYNYHWALFLRSGENEIYRFNPKLGERTIQTVLLKGKVF